MHQSGIMSFNRSELEYIGSKNKEIDLPNIKPYLSWDLTSRSKKVVEGELVYKSSNFLWTTVYRLKMINESKGELIAEAVITNNSDIFVLVPLISNVPVTAI